MKWRQAIFFAPIPTSELFKLLIRQQTFQEGNMPRKEILFAYQKVSQALPERICTLPCMSFQSPFLARSVPFFQVTH